MQWATEDTRNIAIRCSVMTQVDCWRVVKAYTELVILGGDRIRQLEGEIAAVQAYVAKEPDDQTSQRMVGAYQVSRAAYQTAKMLGFDDSLASIVSKMAAEHASVVLLEAKGLSLPITKSSWPLDDDIPVDDGSEHGKGMDAGPGTGTIPPGFLSSFGEDESNG